MSVRRPHRTIRVDKDWVKPLDRSSVGNFDADIWINSHFSLKEETVREELEERSDNHWSRRRNKLERIENGIREKYRVETLLGISPEKEPVSRMKLTAFKLVSCLFTTLLLAVIAFGYPASNSEAVSVFVCDISSLNRTDIENDVTGNYVICRFWIAGIPLVRNTGMTHKRRVPFSRWASIIRNATRIFLHCKHVGCTW